MKIFSAEQIYQADAKTLEREGISSEELMERAATQVFEWIHSRLQGAPTRIQIFCGVGNNGGDGMVVARQLVEHGYEVLVHVLDYSPNRSEDFLLNMNRLKERKHWPNFLDQAAELPAIAAQDLVVDAIFGIGLSRPVEPWVAEQLKNINASGAFVLSVDIPSGLYTDRVPEVGSTVVKAQHVLSFQVPKLVFFLPQTGVYVGSWEVLDIGLDPLFLEVAETEYEYITPLTVRQWYKPREKFSHKGTYGHALLVGGSYGKIGAVNLAAKGCLRTGSGLVTAYVPQCGYLPIQVALPEAMVITDEGEKLLESIAYELEPTVIGMGMGMGTAPETQLALEQFLKVNTKPLVLDADALNILSQKPELLELLPKGCVLTPHPKELERLMGEWQDDFDKLEMARAFSEKYACVLVIKGAHTLVLWNGRGYVNATGNPGMATGGSGDVLAGMITALMAQGYAAKEAAVVGVYVHGLAGDLAAHEMGWEAVTASAIVDTIGGAFVALLRPEGKAGNQETAED